MAGFVICTSKEERRLAFLFFFIISTFVPVISRSSDLQLVEAEREMKDLGKLFGQRLLSLQVLHGSVRRAGQGLQQAAQGVLCRDTCEMLMLLNLYAAVARRLRLGRRLRSRAVGHSSITFGTLIQVTRFL